MITELDDYDRRNIRAWTRAFIARHKDTEPTVEEVWQFANSIVTVTRPQYNCRECKRVLSARAMMRPCVFCGFKGNHKEYNALQSMRQSIKKAGAKRRKINQLKELEETQRNSTLNT